MLSLTFTSLRTLLIPEQAPHFSGLWEMAVKSMKTHLSHIVGNARLPFNSSN